jgi:hypothetical protein
MRLNALNKSLLVLAKISAGQSTNQAIEVTNLQLNTKLHIILLDLQLKFWLWIEDIL